MPIEQPESVGVSRLLRQDALGGGRASGYSGTDRDHDGLIPASFVICSFQETNFLQQAGSGTDALTDKRRLSELYPLRTVEPNSQVIDTIEVVAPTSIS